MKRFLFASAFVLVAALAFVGCADDDNDGSVPATAIVLDVESKTLGVGETLQLTATPAPSDTTDPVVWSSDEETVATVSETGLVTAVAPGTAVIKAVCGSVSATCTIEVADYKRVSFESDENITDYLGAPVELGHIDVYSYGAIVYSRDHVFWAKPYAAEEDDYEQLYWQGPYFQALNDMVMFGGYYNDGTLYDENGVAVTDTWGGFVLSQHANKTVPEDPNTNWYNQFDVWAEGGANGTVTFAVGYDSNTAGEGWSRPLEYNAPQIDFAEPVKPVRVYLANSNFTYSYFTGDASDSYAVKITGWLSGVEGKSVTCTLVDGATRVEGWIPVDLSELGEVDKITFKSVIAAGSLTPCYFCLDDLYLE